MKIIRASVKRLANFIGRFVGGVVAQFGIAAGAEPARDGAAELHFVRRDGTGERLHVGVDRDEIGFVQSVEHDAIERIRAGAADADDFDRNDFLFAFRQAVVAVELDHSLIRSAVTVMSSARGLRLVRWRS